MNEGPKQGAFEDSFLQKNNSGMYNVFLRPIDESYSNNLPLSKQSSFDRADRTSNFQKKTSENSRKQGGAVNLSPDSSI